MSLPILNCEYPGWGFQLLSYLSSQTELDLINFNFDDHRGVCEYWDNLAKQHSMEIEIDDYDPKAKAIHFRRKAN